MGCGASTPVDALPEGAESYTYFEHSTLAAAELRRGHKNVDPETDDDAVLMRALFQSSDTVIQKLSGKGTEETVKLVDPAMSGVYYVLAYKNHGSVPGKSVLITSGTEAWLLFFKGTKLTQMGTVFVHRLAHKDALPEDPTIGHSKIIKMSCERWRLYDGADSNDSNSLVATAKDGGFAFCGLSAQVAPGRADTGFLLALLIGAHLLVMTQMYYRPSEKRALGDKGSLGALLGKGFVNGLNPITTFTDPLGNKMVQGIRAAAGADLNHGHDSRVFHGLSRWILDSVVKAA